MAETHNTNNLSHTGENSHQVCIPFSGGESKKAKAATKAYKACLKEVRKAESEDAA